MLGLNQIPEDFKKKFDIINSIEGSVKGLTIDEICESANISRTTFYRLFSSREEFENWYLIFTASVGIDQIGRTLTWEEGMELHFQLLSQECNYLKNTLNDWSEDDGNIMTLHRIEAMKTTLRDFRHVDIDPELDFQISAYSFAESRWARKWLGSGMKSYSYKDFARYLESCVPKRLHDLLSE